MIVVFGSSPNAFAAAMALREAGQAVTLVETAARLGVPYVQEEKWESGLSVWHAAGPEVVRYTGRTVLLGDGRWLRATPTALEGDVQAEDASRWPDFCRLVDDASTLLRQLWDRQGDLLQHWRALGRRQSMEVLRLPWTPLRELLDEYFRDEALKGMLAEAALEGVLQGPFASGTSWHLLRRWALGDLLTPALAVGGSGRAIQTLADQATAAGVRILHAPGSGATVDGSTLRLDSETVPFQRLLSDRDAGWTFTQLVSPRELETEFNTAVRNIRSRGSWVRLGGFSDARPPASPTDVYHLRSSLPALEKAYDPTKFGRHSDTPPLTFSWPGFVDSSRSQDIVEASLSYLPAAGADVSDRACGLLTSALGAEVCHFHCWTPLHYQAHWGCTGGHLWGGETDLSQSFFLRPMADYHAPLDHVDLCGAARSGDFSGRAGREAVQRLTLLVQAGT